VNGGGSVEILVIRSGRFSAGIDTGEVAEVYSGSAVRQSGLAESFKAGRAYYDLSAILGNRGCEEGTCLIRVMRKDKGDCLVECPSIDGVAAFPVSEILVLPEFVRKLQNPLFVWGLVRHGGTDVPLVTFMRM
jgi:hypothetical protein